MLQLCAPAAGRAAGRGLQEGLEPWAARRQPPAMNPRFLATLDADLRLVPCSVRVGQAVERYVICMLGKSLIS